MSPAARFWAVDLHVHTPASPDARPEAFGSPENIVDAAISAGLDAIAITDHNTAAWCDSVAAAAHGRQLVVLPGVEISTTEGHLLAIWDEGTPSRVIDELLVKVNIGHGQRGRLEVAANVGLAQAAERVASCGGLAIAAHIDRPKGLLGLPVAAHVNQTLLEEALAGVEVVALDTVSTVAAKVGSKRLVGCVRGSDTWDVETSAHGLSGIGARRTWVKASRPDLIGIRHALADPALRISLTDPPSGDYPQLRRVEISGGFLDGQAIDLCPDLNCLLGGTGTGKSLIIEAIRYAMCQQLDRAVFPTLWNEVHSRLASALTANGVIRLELSVAGQCYRVARVFGRDGTATPIVSQRIVDDWVEVKSHPAGLLTLAAFSQGEILEYSRQPVGRMSLVDSGIDLRELNVAFTRLSEALKKNGRSLIMARQREHTLEAQLIHESETAEQVRALSALFNTSVAQEQAGWQRESTQLRRVQMTLQAIQAPTLPVPTPINSSENSVNEDLIDRAKDVLDTLSTSVASGLANLNFAVETARVDWSKVITDWDDRYDAFKKRLDAELVKLEQGASLSILRERLESKQAELEDLRMKREELQGEARPNRARLETERERLLQELSDARRCRRTIRRTRVAALNAKTAGYVKLDIPDRGDYTDFRSALDKLKVGSRVRDGVLEAISRTVHPFRFARALWNNDLEQIAKGHEDIDAGSLDRLRENIDRRDLWGELLEAQTLDRPDILTVKFRKPDDGTYARIEDLAHGQKCTAILVILLADGENPVLVDQPEDALHAPWIEEYLVDQLRNLRGSRQYVFATRSPGIVVSGDAEQIITMRATAGYGQVEASGSLERYDLNQLALHHLEGGPVPFARRFRKLGVSVTAKV